MRTTTTILALALLVAPLAGHAAERRRAAAPRIDDQDLVIVFTTAVSAQQPELGVVDAGSIRRRASCDRVGVRVERRSRIGGGTALLTAQLISPDPRYRVLVDGIELGPAPRVVDARATVGADRPHRITIEVPPSSPEGPIAAAIRWDATLN